MTKIRARRILPRLWESFRRLLNGRWFGMRWIGVGVAAVGVLAVVLVWGPLAGLRRRTVSVEVLARELVVLDHSRMAGVERPETGRDELLWEVYLPPGGAYRLGIATRAIAAGGMVPPGHSLTIGPGDHRVEFSQKPAGPVWLLVVTIDGKPRLTVEEPAGWDPGLGAIRAGLGRGALQPAPDQPLELLRLRFRYPRQSGSSFVPPESCSGVLLWIDRVPPLARGDLLPGPGGSIWGRSSGTMPLQPQQDRPVGNRPGVAQLGAASPE